jgi:hypothetical protein
MERFQNRQQQEDSANTSAEETAITMLRTIMKVMLGMRLGNAMKKTVYGDWEYGSGGLALVGGNSPKPGDHAMERTFSTIRLGFGSCSFSMCGE